MSVPFRLELYKGHSWAIVMFTISMDWIFKCSQVADGVRLGGHCQWKLRCQWSLHYSETHFYITITWPTLLCSCNLSCCSRTLWHVEFWTIKQLANKAAEQYTLMLMDFVRWNTHFVVSFFFLLSSYLLCHHRFYKFWIHRVSLKSWLQLWSLTPSSDLKKLLFNEKRKLQDTEMKLLDWKVQTVNWRVCGQSLYFVRVKCVFGKWKSKRFEFFSNALVFWVCLSKSHNSSF